MLVLGKCVVQCLEDLVWFDYFKFTAPQSAPWAFPFALSSRAASHRFQILNLMMFELISSDKISPALLTDRGNVKAKAEASKELTATGAHSFQHCCQCVPGSCP